MTFDAARLADYRQQTFRLSASAKLKSKEEAVAFVQQRGFVYFWPIKEITFPSLWTAVAGDRPVADKHDDPGHVTWGWKDQLLDRRQWYYAKILRGRATAIALDVAPAFYALSENYGDPENDYLQLYDEGLLTREARAIYEALLAEGPLDTVNMRRKIHMTSSKSNSPFERALTALQRDFKILPVGVSDAGAWHYSYIYDLTHRYYPELLEKARPIGRHEARERLLEHYFDSVGAATAGEARKLFQWSPRETERALASLVEKGRLQTGLRLANAKEDAYVIPALL
jgi:hypothetical protein